MSVGAAIRKLADDLVDVSLRDDPFWASFMDIEGYDDKVPDLSPAAQETWRNQIVDILVRCGEVQADPADAESGVLLSAVRDKALRSLAAADSRVAEFSVTTFPLAGPSRVLLVASRTQLRDPDAAGAYVRRCRRLPAYLDQYTQLVQAAANEGLLPVAPLVSDAIRQLQEHIADPEHDPMVSRRPPEGWSGAEAWQDELHEVVRDEVRPAIARYLDLLTSLLPKCRPPENAGLLYVPGGVAAYACRVRVGTTLPLDPDEIHAIGLSDLAEFEEQIAELGQDVLGALGIADVRAQLRADATRQSWDSAGAMAGAAEAIKRAEEVLPDLFHAPLPPPCGVDAMPAHMAQFGAPPYYSPPARDGSRPGAYLLNTAVPGAAGSWALEATAFHEAVPGHHSQFARLQQMAQLPRLLASFSVVPHSEGWGLYAEQLADEFGLYSDDAQRLGMLGCAAWRAVRLVVDTGIHARGWSRERALQFALAHSPFPESFVTPEIDRYIAVPGQALGYHIGKREILRLRDLAKAQLGAAFDIRDFHSAVLDHGALPLPVLGQVVAAWITARSGNGASAGG
jgi:uncharacterized protein (DUF885 family)